MSCSGKDIYAFALTRTNELNNIKKPRKHRNKLYKIYVFYKSMEVENITMEDLVIKCTSEQYSNQ